MKALLGLFLLSVLLTTGYCLECETCVAQATSCTGNKVTCPRGQDACLNALTELTVAGSKITTVTKTCFTMDGCKALKPGSSSSFGGAGALIKSVQCSKAPISSGSLFLALSGLLFLKLLW